MAYLKPVTGWVIVDNKGEPVVRTFSKESESACIDKWYKEKAFEQGMGIGDSVGPFAWWEGQKKNYKYDVAACNIIQPVTFMAKENTSV